MKRVGLGGRAWRLWFLRERLERMHEYYIDKMIKAWEKDEDIVSLEWRLSPNLERQAENQGLEGILKRIKKDIREIFRISGYRGSANLLLREENDTHYFTLFAPHHLLEQGPTLSLLRDYFAASYHSFFTPGDEKSFEEFMKRRSSAYTMMNEEGMDKEE